MRRHTPNTHPSSTPAPCSPSSGAGVRNRISRNIAVVVVGGVSSIRFNSFVFVLQGNVSSLLLSRACPCFVNHINDIIFLIIYCFYYCCRRFILKSCFYDKNVRMRCYSGRPYCTGLSCLHCFEAICFKISKKKELNLNQCLWINIKNLSSERSGLSIARGFRMF